jgi:sulfur carrier protein ThiS
MKNWTVRWVPCDRDMKVKVKLYGTIGANFPGYSHTEGIEIVIPDGGKVKDLLTALKIAKELGAIIAVEGRILKPEDPLHDDASVNVLSPMSGG